MSDKNLPASTPATPFVDELDAHIAEAMQDPEFRAASEDVDHRYELIAELVARRKALGLTQKDVARRMDVKQPTISGFETEGSDPRLSTVQRYARAVEARCVVSVKIAEHCDWVKPSVAYAEEGGRKQVRVDVKGPSALALAWALRNDFALAA